MANYNIDAIYNGNTSLPGTERIRIDSSGNVGIGTASPIAPLDVQSNTGGTGIIIRGRSDNSTALRFYANNATTQQAYIGADDSNIDFLSVATRPIRFFVNSLIQYQINQLGVFSWYDGAGGTRMTLNSTGLGIGTTSPTRKLHIYSAQSVIALSNTGTGAWSGLQWSVGNGAYTAYSGLLDDTGRYFIDVGSNGDDFTILQNGNVGIGTTSPSTKLQVKGVITAGSVDSVSGSTLLLGQYGDGNLTVLGTEYSSGGPVLAYAVSPSTSAAGAFLSSTGITISRSAYTQDGGTHRWFTGSSQAVAIGSAVSMSEKMRIDSSGNVGIGTTSPSLTSGYVGLNVVNAGYTQIKVQSSASSAGIEFKPSSGNSWELQANNSNQWFVFDRTQDVYRLTIDVNGNVGIGTSSPSAKIELYNGNFKISDGNRIIFGASDPQIYGNSGVLTFRTNSSDRMYLDTNGNLGIGTTSPNKPLDVVSNSSANGLQIRNRSNDDYGFIIFNNYAGSETSIAQIGAYRTGVNQGSLLIYTGITEKVRINNDGNVGIGTTNPTYKLHVNGDLRATSGSFTAALTGTKGIFSDSSGSGSVIEAYNTVATNGTTAIFRQTTAGGNGNQDIGLLVDIQGANDLDRIANFRYYDGSTYTSRMAIMRGGNVGIGTTSPAYKLDVNGTTRFGGIVYNEAVQTDDFNYFNLQPYIESETTNNVLPFFGTAPTFVTLTNTTAPFSKVMSFSAYAEAALADYIPVQAGETIYGEIWVFRSTGAPGTAGGFYCGVARYDKDKKMIDGNLGLTYFIASGYTVPSTSTWTKYSGVTTLPLTHTPVAGSDGGPARYVRPYIIVNNPSGTILTYITGWKIRKVELTRDSGIVSINGNLGIGTTSPAYKLDINSANDDALRIRNGAGGANNGLALCIGSGSPWLDITEGVEFRIKGNTYANLGTWNSGNNTKLLINSSGNIGIGTTSPNSKLQIGGTTTGLLTVGTLTNDWDGVVAIGTPNGNGIILSKVNTSNDANRVLTIVRDDTNGASILGYTPTGTSTSVGFQIRASASSYFNGGNVGIGTTSPGYKLDVSGTGRFTGDLTLSGALTTNVGGTSIFIGNQNVTTSNGLRINFHTDADLSYYIGKKAGAWTQPLDINFYTGIRLYASSSYDYGISFWNSNNTTKMMSVGEGDSNVRVANTIYATAFSGPLTGNVTGTATSISGFNNPTTAATANTIVYRDSGGDISTRYFLGSYVNSTDDTSSTGLTYIMAKFGNDYHRSASAAKVATFISGQTMDINGSSTSCSGSAASAGALNTNNDYTVASLTSNGFVYSGSGAGSTGAFYFNTSSHGIRRASGTNDVYCYTTSGTLYLGAGGSSTTHVRVTSGGDVGIGVSPSYKLDVNGNIHATAFPTSSDIRFKKNITALENSLEKVKKLQGVKYEWNEFVNSVRDGYKLNVPIIGLIAQDVEKIVPEVVDLWKLSDECQDARSIDYPRLIPLLIEAIKEQQIIIENQNQKIENLISRVSALEAK